MKRKNKRERERERVESSNETSAAEMFTNAISTSQTNYWRHKPRRTEKSGPWSDSTHYGSEATEKPLEWVPALTHKMTDEKRDVVMEGIEKTAKNYEGGSEERELYSAGRRREGSRKPKPRAEAAINTTKIIEWRIRIRHSSSLNKKNAMNVFFIVEINTYRSNFCE